MDKLLVIYGLELYCHKEPKERGHDLTLGESPLCPRTVRISLISSPHSLRAALISL